MKKVLTMLTILAAASAVQAETYHRSLPDGMSKFEALKVSLDSPGTPIYKCNQVMITQKGTFKNVPKTGANDFVVQPKKKAD
jgi:hypothetical protein